MSDPLIDAARLIDSGSVPSIDGECLVPVEAMFIEYEGLRFRLPAQVATGRKVLDPESGVTKYEFTVAQTPDTYGIHIGPAFGDNVV